MWTHLKALRLDEDENNIADLLKVLTRGGYLLKQRDQLAQDVQNEYKLGQRAKEEYGREVMQATIKSASLVI